MLIADGSVAADRNITLFSKTAFFLKKTLSLYFLILVLFSCKKKKSQLKWPTVEDCLLLGSRKTQHFWYPNLKNIEEPTDIAMSETEVQTPSL